MTRIALSLDFALHETESQRVLWSVQIIRK